MRRYLPLAVCLLSLVTGAGCGPAGARGPGDGRNPGDPVDQGMTDADPGDLGATDLAGSDAATCPSNCSLGAKSCDGNAVRTCEPAGACTAWSTGVACPTGEVCSGGLCVQSCVDQCTSGATYCSGAGFRTCVTAASGCTEWSATVTPCGAGQVCSGGVCAATCTDRCAAAAQQCAGSGIQACEKKATGCWDWGDPTPCPTGQVCSGGSCAVGCADQCAMGQTQCAGADAYQVCEKQASGCLDWSLAQVCPSGMCSGGGCVGCTDGAKRCGPSGNVESCANGMWAQVQACAFGCMGGACTVNTMCTSGSYRCNGNVVEVCNSSGTAYLHAASCAVACSGGLCTGGCTPGEHRCNGNKREQCDANGTAWTVVETCGAYCDAFAAKCALDKLDITVSQDLDGEIVVDGAVTIASPAKVTVPSGRLTIRAKSIVLAAGAAIEVTPIGGSPEGTASKPCSNNENDGSGGGYGTPGSRGACGDSYVGPAFGSATDAVVQPGGAGGNGYTAGCLTNGRGGAGGGVLRLIADTIVIGGQISAKGQDGLNGTGTSCGGGGGGAGGGILIAGDDVTVQSTAIISATGGQRGTGYYNGGNGGVGRIKVLYGSKLSLGPAAITPAPTEGLLPPLRITSSTHPNPRLFYNDDFRSVGITWIRSFPSLQGYWWLVSNNAFQVPTPAPSSTFTLAEQASIDPSLLDPGAQGKQWVNYHFHIVPVNATSEPGTVENNFGVKVNAQPPNVTSPTHPNQTTWYAGKTVYFTWTLPAPANADENYRGFYYVFDHYGDTVPTPSATFIGVGQKQLTLSNVDDGIWAFHLITVDTQGYLTKKAQHYKVRIGTDPGSSNVSGQVFEKGTGGPTPLQGATVSINRKLFVSDVKSGADGMFNFGGAVPIGTWEIQASMPGYKTEVKIVPVPASGAMATFTLDKLP